MYYAATYRSLTSTSSVGRVASGWDWYSCASAIPVSERTRLAVRISANYEFTSSIEIGLKDTTDVR